MSLFPSWFHEKAISVPSGEKVGESSSPGYAVKGMAVIGSTEPLPREWATYRTPANPSAILAIAAVDHQRHVVRVGAAGTVALSFLDSDSSLISSSATFKSDMCCQRRAGSFRRQRLTRCSISGGTETMTSQTGFGSRCRIADSVDRCESPWKA